VTGVQNAYYSLLASSPGSLILEYPQSASRNWAQWLAPIGEKGVELAARMGTRPSLLERYRTARNWFDQSEKSSGSNCGK
jgi:hypothetical protein